MSELKVFVWEKVLCDYTCGMVFAIATNKEEAIKILGKQGLYETSQMELREIKPKIFPVDKKIGFWVFGGG